VCCRPAPWPLVDARTVAARHVPDHLHIGLPRAGGTKAVRTWRTSSEFGGDLDVGSRLWNGQLVGGQDGWARWRRWSWQASPVLRWQLRRPPSGCPSKRRDRCLTVPIRSMPVGGSAFEAITGQVEVRGRPARQCALVGGVTEQPAGLVRTTPVDPGWQEKSACDGHWQW
jgi:hypothetical protein